MQPVSRSKASINCKKVSDEQMSLHLFSQPRRCAAKNSVPFELRQATPKKPNILPIFLSFTDRPARLKSIACCFLITKRALRRPLIYEVHELPQRANASVKLDARMSHDRYLGILPIISNKPAVDPDAVPMAAASARTAPSLFFRPTLRHTWQSGARDCLGPRSLAGPMTTQRSPR